MKHFVDGDHMAIVQDQFVDLQESPAVFVNRDSNIGRTIERDGIIGLAIGDLIETRNRLQAEEMAQRSVTMLDMALSRDEEYDPADAFGDWWEG